MIEEHTYSTHTATAEETKCVASALASFLQPGDIILLSGDLGAGKTQFVQGVARGLQITDDVTSPTFNILLTYEGALPLYHFDLYRLDEESQLDDIDFYGTLEGDGASFIEWGDRFPQAMPDDCLEITITTEATSAQDAGDRILCARATGGRSTALLNAWVQAAGLEREDGMAQA